VDLVCCFSSSGLFVSSAAFGAVCFSFCGCLSLVCLFFTPPIGMPYTLGGGLIIFPISKKKNIHIN
jgi:hypothetical protein